MEHEYLYHYSYKLNKDTKKISIIKQKDKIVKETAKTVVYYSACNNRTRHKSDLDTLNDFLSMQSLNPNAEDQYIELLKSDLTDVITRHQERIDWAKDRLSALEANEISVDEK